MTKSNRNNLLLRLLKYVLLDILKNRMVLFYTLFLLATSFGLFSMSGDATKGIASLLNIVLLVSPLLSLIFSTIYFYNSYEFIELLSAQPIQRKTILYSQYWGLCISLIVALVIGLGIPLLIFAPSKAALSLLIVSCGLTMAFVSLALLAALLTRDKARGIGLSLLMWFYFTFIYDAMMLMIMFAYIDYPMETITLTMISLNPIDLARVIVLLQHDVSALMGYTGALLQELFSSGKGVLLASGVMLIWIFVPLKLAIRLFNKRDL
ncbi:MAG: ABC transporter permease subunit [Bacteroidetes bacterium]|nr:ABC transporter permease subunit [Bacteroidota bacterium]